MRTVTVSLIGDHVEAVTYAPGHFPRLIDLERLPAPRDSSPPAREMPAIAWTDGTQHLVGTLAQRAIDRRLDGAVWRWSGGQETVTPTGRNTDTQVLTPLTAKARLFRRVLAATKRDTAVTPTAIVVMIPDGQSSSAVREIEAACLVAGAREVVVRTVGEAANRIAAKDGERGSALVIDLLSPSPTWTAYRVSGTQGERTAGGSIPLPSDAGTSLRAGGSSHRMNRYWQGCEPAQTAPAIAKIDADDAAIGTLVSDHQVETAMVAVWRAAAKGIATANLSIADFTRVIVLAGAHNRVRRMAPADLQRASVLWNEGNAETLSALAAREDSDFGKHYGAPFRLVLRAASEARSVIAAWPDLEAAPANCRVPYTFRVDAIQPDRLFSALSLRLIGSDNPAGIELSPVANPPLIQQRGAVGLNGVIHAVCNGLVLIEYAYVTDADRQVVMLAYDPATPELPTLRLSPETFDSIRDPAI